MSQFLFTLCNPSEEILEGVNKIEADYIASCQDGNNILIYKEVDKISLKKFKKTHFQDGKTKVESVRVQQRSFILYSMSECKGFTESGERKKLKIYWSEIPYERDDTSYCTVCRNNRIKDEFGVLKNGKTRKTCNRCVLRIKEKNQ